MRNVSRAVSIAICSIFGIGFVPRGPATIGTLVGGLIFYAIQPTSFVGALSLVTAVLVVGIGLASIISRDLNDPDPQFIIIDEVVGVWVALLFLPHRVETYLMAMILFRFFDKTKIGGIRMVEKLPLGFGIMLDDVVAGIYTNLPIQIILISSGIATSR